jgi:enoyl-CoA hydratase
MSDEILYEVADPVATIRLNRPDKLNALTYPMLRALREAVDSASDDPRVVGIVLTGEGRGFCAGLDASVLAATSAQGSGARQREAPGELPGLASYLLRVPKPVIAAVNGPAVTGGLELVLNCDIVICSERAVFADTHARVGVLPGWGLSVLLPLAVGRSRARQMSFTGDFLPAVQALTAGLVSEVVRHDNLLGRAREIAGSIAGNDTRAVRALLASYRQVEAEGVAGGFAAEEQAARAWGRSGLDLEETGRRRAAVTERGRSQAVRHEP